MFCPSRLDFRYNKAHPMEQLPPFIPGLELSRRFYWEAVRPLLDDCFPALPYAAGLIGPGSDVLGFDTPRSRDHDWYPRLLLFLPASQAEAKASIHEMLAARLPHDFLGYPVDAAPVADEPGTHVMRRALTGPVNHRVTPVTLETFFQRWLAWDITRPLEPVDWLTFPSQALRSLTAGEIFYDGVGEATSLRQRLVWYPHEVWLYLLACGWRRIGQEAPLMGRAGEVGDELGSALIAGRLARDIMSLCFLMEKQYAPYPKWFGTAFQQLACAGELSPWLWRIVQAATWSERETALVAAYEHLARRHNRLQITAPLPEKVVYFYDRPFKIIQDEKFTAAILEKIQDEQLKSMAQRGLIGNLDQFSDSTDLRSDPTWRSNLRRLYGIPDRT